MIIGILQVNLHLPGNNSLKGKRMVLKSLKDRLRNTFNVSVAEVGNEDEWTLSELALATVGRDAPRVQSVMSKMLEFIRSDRNVEVVGDRIEII